MNTRQLKYVLAVAEEKNFSKAAKKLFIAQPSLSQYIQKLEEELGVELFDRTTSPIRLTYAGDIYVKSAAKILDFEKQLSQQMHDVVNSQKGRLIIGVSPYRSTYLVPESLGIFHKKFPEIEIVLVEKINAELEYLVLKGEVDIAFTALPVKKEEFDYEPIMTEDIILAVPRKDYDSKLTSTPNDNNFTPVNLRKFKDASFITLNSDQMMHKLTMSLCKQAGFKPKIILECRGIDAAHAMVTAGIGVTFVPSTLIKYGNFMKHPHYYTIDDIFPKREVSVIYRKNRYLSKAALAFISILKSTLSKTFEDNS